MKLDEFKNKKKNLGNVTFYAKQKATCHIHKNVFYFNVIIDVAIYKFISL